MGESKSKAYAAGYSHGKAKGSWVLDGNSTREQATRILEGYEEGDPEVMDMCPAPLSGEWAGESMSEIGNHYGVDLDDDDNCTDFEEGFSDGFWSEVLASARVHADVVDIEE